MPNKSKHAFGTLERIDSAIASGAINAYDILFVKDANGKPYIGWIDKNGKKVIVDNSSVDIAELETLIATKATVEEVEAKIATSVSSALAEAKAYTDSLVVNSGGSDPGVTEEMLNTMKQVAVDEAIVNAISRDELLEADLKKYIDNQDAIVITAQEATQASLNSAIERITKNEQDIANFVPGTGEGVDTSALLATLKEYVDEAVAQTTQVQIITWEADD